MIYHVFQLQLHKEQVGGIVCTACEEVIGYVEDWIDANKTIEEIEVLLDELCADLGGGIFTTVCEQIVAYGVDEIYQYLEDNWTPEEVCVELSLCDAVQQPVFTVTNYVLTGTGTSWWNSLHCL